MSFFRPESPPPRQPSPDFLPVPLPHPRHRSSHPQIRVIDPLHGRNIHAMRSMDLTSERATMSRQLGDSLSWQRQRTQSTHTSRSTHSSRSSPRRSPCPSPRSDVPSSVGHKRTLSVVIPIVIPSPAPSPTPTMVSPLPPPLKSAACYGIACPQPVSLKPIVFEQSEGLCATDRTSTRHLLQKPSTSSLKSLPPLGKRKSVSNACLRLFGFKPLLKQLPSDPAGL